MRGCPECEPFDDEHDWDYRRCPNCSTFNYFNKKDPIEFRPRFCHKCGWALY
jgi:hypothetical protein